MLAARTAPPHAGFNAFGGNSFDPLVGKPAFNFDKWTFGSLFWLNKTGEQSVVCPGPGRRFGGLPEPLGNCGYWFVPTVAAPCPAAVPNRLARGRPA